jgi:hypothetical protein
VIKRGAGKHLVDQSDRPRQMERPGAARPDAGCCGRQ